MVIIMNEDKKNSKWTSVLKLFLEFIVAAVTALLASSFVKSPAGDTLRIVTRRAQHVAPVHSCTLISEADKWQPLSIDIRFIRA